MKKLLLITALVSSATIANAQTWSNCNGPTMAVTDMYNTGSSLVLSLLYTNNIMKSTDDGANFDTVSVMPSDYNNITNIVGHGTDLFAIGRDAWLSTDNGNTWTKKGSQYPGVTPNDAEFFHDTLYVATNGGVQASEDGGLTFHAVGGGFVNQNVQDIMVHDNALYITTLGSGVYKSTDGNNFTPIMGNLPVGTLGNRIAAIGTTLFYSEYLLGLYKSTDGGTTWTQITTPDLDITYLYVVGSTLVVGGAGGHIFYTTDMGATTTSINLPTASSFAITRRLFYANGYLFNCSDSYGAFRTAISFGPSSVADVKEIDFNLYPNPNSGLFKLSVPEVTSNCRVEVYNVLGQLVYTAAVTAKDNTIDLGTIPTGCYIAKLLSAGGSKSVKFFKQ